MEKEKFAIITGGSSGIGLEFAKQLAALNYNLILISRGLKELTETEVMIKEQYSVEVQTLAKDLSDTKDLKDVLDHLSKVKNVGYLVNNAGSSYIGKFHKVGVKESLHLINLHITATVAITHTCVNHMLQNRSGVIINVSSFSAFMDENPTETLYGPTKNFLVAFSRTLKNNLNNTNIKVQCLCPGYTRTNFHNNDKRALKVPNILWMTTKEVVDISLSKLDKLIVIPGFKNKLLVFLINFAFTKRLFNKT